MRAAPLFLFLFSLSLCAAQVPAQNNKAPKPLLIAVDQPAIIGEPIWVNEITRPNQYSYVAGECIHLELLYDGKAVPRWAVKPVFPGGGGSTSLDISFMLASDCLPTAIRNPPSGKRLPLHAWFQIRLPGRYALRWTNLGRDVKDGKSVTTQVSSAWVTFNVQPSSAADREKWLSHLLAHPPDHASELIGDYIPALVAAAPDERALEAIAARLFSIDLMTESAAEALAYFPEDRVRAVIFELIKKRGPTDYLAHLVSWNSFGLNSDADQRAQLTRACLGYLRSSDPLKAAAAIEMILFIVHFPHQPPTDPNLIALADDEVVRAAPAIIAANHDDLKQALFRYLSVADGAKAHPLLRPIAYSSGPDADAARYALIYHPDPGDLPKLGALLVQSGNPDPQGKNLASVPTELIRGYSDKAIPALQKGLKDSPYLWVRVHCAAELIYKNDPASYRFFLDTLVSNRWSANGVRKSELIQYVKDAFPTELQGKVDLKRVTDFLRARLRQTPSGH